MKYTSKAFSKDGKDIEDMLQMMDAGARMGAGRRAFPSGYFSPADIVLDRGCEMRIAKKMPLKMGEMGNCYMNAQKIAISEWGELLYAEGWATYGGKSNLPVLHAWLVNKQGHVLDPTWGPKIKGRAYYGVIIDTRYMMTRQLQTKRYGPIIDDWEYGHKLLKTPGLVAKVTTKCRRGR